ADTLDMLEEGKNRKQIQKSVSVFGDVTTKLESHQAVTRGIEDILRNVLPYKKRNVKTICSMITKLCLKGEKLNNFFDQVSLQALSGQKNKRVDLKYVDTEGKETEAAQLPKDAVIILALNHDHAMLDLASMKDVAKSLHADTVSVLTTKNAWPIYNFIENKDETVLFTQDKNIKQRVLDLVNKEQGRFVFAIYPEGDLPFFGA